MSKKTVLVLAMMLTFSFFTSYSFAANEGVVNYGDKVIVDSDLDGLTDEGEKQIYGTDLQNNDSDGDGTWDGAEVLGQIAGENAVADISDMTASSANETPWAWYVSRMSALIGFIFLYTSVLMGLAIRIPAVRNFFGAKDTFSVHCWISLQAFLLAAVHGLSLTFDKYMHFSLAAIFIPFKSTFEPAIVSLGVFAFYLMIVLIISSYVKTKIPNVLWRIIHFGNVFLYVFSAIHAWNIGTDFKAEAIRTLFVGLNLVLAIILVWHIIERIKCYRKAAVNQECEILQQ